MGFATGYLARRVFLVPCCACRALVEALADALGTDLLHSVGHYFVDHVDGCSRVTDHLTHKSRHLYVFHALFYAASVLTAAKPPRTFARIPYPTLGRAVA
jgi:hypothetical protein